MSTPPNSDTIEIREVWQENLEDEFSMIRNIVDEYPYVAMDTEFPGIVIRPVGNFSSNYDFNYLTLKSNVDMLKLIQLGLTFSDEQGNLPTCGTGKHCIWQFNFREFNLDTDVFANDSIELLTESGIDFSKNNEQGIDVRRFGELLMSSGVVLNDNVQWVTFHSGYDFGYLLKLLTCQNLPDTQIEFFKLIKAYFPTVYDIKHLMKFCNSLHGGLNKLAELLDVERVGVSHQAGSDRSAMEVPSSWDTLRKQVVYMEMMIDSKGKARKLEAQLDEQMNSFRKLVSTKSDTSNNDLESGIDQLLKQLQQVNNQMQAWVSSGGSEMVSHTLTRHQEILQDLTQEFYRLRSSLRAKQEHASLLDDFRQFDRSRLDLEEGGNSPEQALLKERVSISRNTGQMDTVISQAQSTLGALVTQRSTFGTINSKIGNVSSRLPSISSSDNSTEYR
ncbi:hypothetical protein V2J09_023417 [Rumex salicifolius]